jgi:hypothetical protein
MNLRLVRYGGLGLVGALLTASLVVPGGSAQAAPAGMRAGLVHLNAAKPGKPSGPENKNPCAPDKKPGGEPTKKPATGPEATKADRDKAARAAQDKAAKDKADRDKAGKDKAAKDDPGDKDEPIGVLVCGDILKVTKKHGRILLVVKTEKGTATVLVTGKTVVVKGDLKVPKRALRTGIPVAVKGELLKKGIVLADGILLL